MKHISWPQSKGAFLRASFQPFATRGRIQVGIDPFRGETLSKVGFEDRTPGVRARIWVRFLHTGEAFGLPGKIIATVATAGSLVLVYTGFALSWRRFLRKNSGPLPVVPARVGEQKPAPLGRQA